MRAARIGLLASLGIVLAAAGTAGSGGKPWRWTLPAGMVAPSVPADNAMTAAKVELGRRLFYDADLSINGTISCATCHEQDNSFTVNVQTRPGAHGDPGLRNVPSLLNVAWMSPLNWADPGLGRLEAQAVKPITGDDPVEMGMKGQEGELARRLAADGCYRRMFRAAFPEEKGLIGLDTVVKALAAFQRTIVSFDTAWDRARAGGTPLPALARRGEALFNGDAGCAGCHGGIGFTDGRLHPFAYSARDTGAARATGRAEDVGQFRTPGLRNVMLTAPYLHDGSAPTVAEAIARHGVRLGAENEAAILAFLDQLTDRSVTTDPRFAYPEKICGKPV